MWNVDAFSRLQPGQQMVGSVDPIRFPPTHNAASSVPPPHSASPPPHAPKGTRKGVATGATHGKEGPASQPAGKRRKTHGAGTTVASGRTPPALRQAAARSRKDGVDKGNRVTTNAATPVRQVTAVPSSQQAYSSARASGDSSDLLRRRRSGSSTSTASTLGDKLPAGLQAWYDRWCSGAGSLPTRKGKGAATTAGGAGSASETPDSIVFERASVDEIEKLCSKLSEVNFTPAQVVQVCTDLSQMPGLPSYSSSTALVRTIVRSR